MTKFLDSISFEKLFKSNYQVLCQYAYGIVGDMDQSEDVVQQAFVKMWDKRESMDMNKSLKSYLYTSVRNTSLNFLRDQKKFKSNILDVDIYSSDSFNEGFQGPNELLAEELKVKIESAINKLPEKSLEVFKMSRFEGMKYREISEKLGVTAKTVEAHMSRALRILREELKDYVVNFLIIIMMLLLLYFEL